MLAAPSSRLRTGWNKRGKKETFEDSGHFLFFMYFLAAIMTAAQPTDGSSSLGPWASYTNTSSCELLVSGVCHSDKSDLDTHSTSCLTSIVIDPIYNVNHLDVWGVSLTTPLCRSRNVSETHGLDTNTNSLLDRGGQANLPSGGSGIESASCLFLLWEASHPT